MITKNPGSRSLLVRPAGDIDALLAEHIRSRLLPVLGEGYCFVIFDLEETRYVTSSGLGLFVEVHNRVASNGGSLRLVNCAERIETLLAQTRLDQFLRIPGDPLPLSLPFDALHSLLSSEVLFSSRLHELTEALLEAASPEQVAALVMEGMADACGSGRGGIFLHSGENGDLELVGSIGLDATTFNAAAKVSLAGDGLERVLGRTGADSTVWCTRLGEPAEAPSRLQQILGFEQAIFCCLKSAGQLQAYVLLEAPVLPSLAGDGWVPQLRFYSEISARFLAKAYRVSHLESENAELRRQLADAQRAHNLLVDAGKLAALGTVISGIGHMLNNKLVPIIGYTQMLTQAGNLGQKIQAQLNTVNAAALDLKTTMEQLIKASRAREISPVPTDLNDLLTRALSLASLQLEQQGVKLRLQLDASLPTVSADPDLLLQALLVMIHRASLQFEDGKNDRWVEIRTARSSEGIEIVVQDNGAGLGDASVEAWIDPLAPYVELGSRHLSNYSVPRSVMRRHNGELLLAERNGGGTIVKMMFPLISIAEDLAPLSFSTHG